MGVMYLLCASILVLSVNGQQGVQKVGGGVATTVERFPFAAALISNFGSGTYWQACGGTILTTSAILSAASCFETDGVEHPILWWRARVGTNHGNSGGAVHIIRLITRHPDYDFATKQHDVAVLRPTIELRFSDSVGAASISGAAFTLEDRQEVSAIGWGHINNQAESADELRHVEFWVETQYCSGRYRALGHQVTENMVCAGWLDVGVRGQCQGDSGSPLLVGDVVVGIFSWAEGCAHVLYPGINTRVAPYVSWIVSTAIAPL